MPEPTPLLLGEDEQAWVELEAARLAVRAPDPDAREAYARLQQAVRAGRAEADLLPVLGDLLALGLASGRIRALYGRRAETVASRLFLRCPQGRALAARVEEANRALACLAGQPVEAIRLGVRGPGLYTLTLEAAGCRLALALEPGGVAVHRLDIGLAEGGSAWAGA